MVRRWATLCTVLVLVCLFLAGYSSATPGGVYWATAGAWCFGVAAVLVVVLILRKERTRASIVLGAMTSVVLVISLVVGNTDIVLRDRVAAARSELVSGCVEAAAVSNYGPAGKATGAPVPLREVFGSDLPEVRGFELVGAVEPFRSPSGQLGCRFTVHSVAWTSRTRYGLALSPGGAPMADSGASYRHMVDDWYVWQAVDPAGS